MSKSAVLGCQRRGCNACATPQRSGSDPPLRHARHGPACGTLISVIDSDAKHKHIVLIGSALFIRLSARTHRSCQEGLLARNCDSFGVEQRPNARTRRWSLRQPSSSWLRARHPCLPLSGEARAGLSTGRHADVGDRAANGGARRPRIVVDRASCVEVLFVCSSCTWRACPAHTTSALLLPRILLCAHPFAW